MLAVGILFLVFQDKFLDLFSTRTFTGWDTHSYGFVYFLYFSDALKSGYIPLWNPLIQSGNFFPNFFNVGLFYPFELLFVALSWLIDPIISYELMIQCVIVIGSVGAFLLLHRQANSRFLAFIGALLYGLIVLVPVVGQIWYTISFASLPWLIFACAHLSDSKYFHLNIGWLLFGLLYVFFISGGYLWLNLMNLLLAFTYSFAKGFVATPTNQSVGKRIFAAITKPSILLLIYIACVYACIVLPCYLHLQFNYSEFLGDFASPDGRLRGLKVLGQPAGYGGALETIIGNIDPLISLNQPWAKEGVFTYGGGWPLWLIFTTCLLTRWTRQQLFWLILLCFAITYSTGSDTFLGSILMQIPVINSNRYWVGVGTSYASIFLLLMVVDKLNSIENNVINTRILLVRLAICTALGFAFLAYIHAPAIEFALLIVSALMWSIFLSQSDLVRKLALVMLTLMSVSYVLMTPYRGYSNPLVESDYLNKIDQRKQDITVTKNSRKLASGTEFNYYDTEWIYKKIPFAHGYNHLGHPQYWYVKNNPFLEKIVVVTQYARPALEIQRKNLSSDNEYAEKVATDILSNPDSPTIEPARYLGIEPSSQFTSKISQLVVNPNDVSFQVDINAPAHVILNMLYAPGWAVSINGVKQTIYRTNHLFQGVDLKTAGSYHVVFSYRPYLSIALLTAPYLLLLTLLVQYVAKRMKRTKSSLLQKA